MILAERNFDLIAMRAAGREWRNEKQNIMEYKYVTNLGKAKNG
jgi:hypothetical protein